MKAFCKGFSLPLQCRHRVIRLPLYIHYITLFLRKKILHQHIVQENYFMFLLHLLQHSLALRMCTHIERKRGGKNKKSWNGCLMMTLSILVTKEDASHLFSLSLTCFYAIIKKSFFQFPSFLSTLFHSTFFLLAPSSLNRKFWNCNWKM